MSVGPSGSCAVEMPGWRDDSPSRVRQLFGDVDWRSAGSRIPGVPQHNLKANLSATIRHFTVGGNLLRLIGEADDVLGHNHKDPRFLSPGAPRALWVGIELSLP